MKQTTQIGVERPFPPTRAEFEMLNRELDKNQETIKKLVEAVKGLLSAYGQYMIKADKEEYMATLKAHEALSLATSTQGEPEIERIRRLARSFAIFFILLASPAIAKEGLFSQTDATKIKCNEITPFHSQQEAQLKANSSQMVIKEQGKNIWYVMPKYDGVLIGGCTEKESL